MAERLTGLDASFLYLETPAQLMHVCGLIELDVSTMPGGYSFARLRDALAERVADVPHFTRRIKRTPLDLDHPSWVEDTRFDITRHVHRLGLPGARGREELLEVASDLAGLPLDRSRPLWEMWVIESADPDRVVVFSKMHHATVDGVSGSNLISHLCSLEPDSGPLGDTADLTPTGKAPGGVRMLVGGLARQVVSRPLGAVKVATGSVGAVVDTVGRVRQGATMAAPLTAPRTSFNGTISGRRCVAVTDLSLEHVKEIKNATGTTVNDVVLTLTGGVLREYLLERGELPATSLRAVVPVSVRERSQRRLGANKISGLFAQLGTDIADPLERLEHLQQHFRDAKEHQKAVGADVLQDWAEFAAPRTFGLAVRAYAGLRLAEKHPVVHNLVISNVPGPPLPIYFAGCRVRNLYPLGPVFHGAGVNITVLSQDGRLNVGVISCYHSMPDPHLLVDRFEDQLDELRKAVAERG